MNEQSMRFRVGLFVLAGIVLLAVLIVMFGGVPGAFALRGQNTFTILFQQAPGVEPGTPVRRSGVRIGEVKNVELKPDGTVIVTIGVDPKFPLMTTDRPRISQSLIGGDTTIDFIPAAPGEQSSGSEEAEADDPPPAGQAKPGQVFKAAEPAKPGHEFKGGEPTDTRALVKEARDLMPATRETLEDMRRTLRRFERTAPQLEDTAREFRELARSVREMLPELRQANTDIRALTKSALDTMPQLRRTLQEAEVTARNWGQLGERLDVLVRTNEDKAVKALDNFNEAMVRIGNTFNEENQRNVSASLKNLRQSSETLQGVTKNADELVKESRQTVQRLNDTITRSNDVVDNLQRATKPFADSSDRIMKNFDEGAAKFNRNMDSFQSAFTGFNNPNGTLGRLLNDPSLYNNVNDAACMINRLMPKLDQILRDFEVFSDKVARHPETLGVRGAVRPSSGLKEAPTPEMYWPNH